MQQDAKRSRIDDDSMLSLRIVADILKGVVLTEVYSPDRVVRACHELGLIKGDSFELRTGFDLSKPEVQRAVSRKITESDPVLIILSPPCTKFSRLQAINLAMHGPEWAARFEIEKAEAIEHLRYSMQLAKSRIRRGAYSSSSTPMERHRGISSASRKLQPSPE